jgi:hypothetical protein
MAEDVIRLAGLYVGRGREASKWRLYWTGNFSRYFEFLKEDTLHAERLADGTVVAWLRPGAHVNHATMTVADPADFLQGGLLDNLRSTSDSETIRDLLGLGAASACDSKGDKDGGTDGGGQPPKPKSGPVEAASPPTTCSMPGCCEFK